MIEDLLQEIVALEKEQEAKVRNSVQEATDIVLRAKEKAVAISDDADAKIKELSSKNIEKANKDAKKLSDKIISNATEKANSIIESADKNSDKIITDIIGRLEIRYA